MEISVFWVIITLFIAFTVLYLLQDSPFIAEKQNKEYINSVTANNTWYNTIASITLGIVIFLTIFILLDTQKTVII